ncbi:MAG TPA: MauE/DoxX family redox-associated membrane protein [Candidatus Babeliales bacterium]|nr:MauE/DoxX family redox-associated membrane protein [Candidatus Babeliales bacterium]
MLNKNFLPLITIGSIIIFLTAAKQFFYGFDIHSAMYDFMGIYFIIFSLFKIINLKGFAEAYSTYDIIAKRSAAYAYMYPFIELILGLLYLMRFQLLITNWATLLLMAISSIGVAYELSQKKEIMCACLGVIFKIPMTYVTLAEDLIMGIMAFIMLIHYYI